MAVPVAPLLQVPPVVASVSVTVLPAQTLAADGDIGAGAAITVTVAETEQVPIEYLTVSTPAVIPVTRPEVFTVAWVLVTLHAPPPELDNDTVPPEHIDELAGVMAAGEGFTVTGVVTTPEEHVLSVAVTE